MTILPKDAQATPISPSFHQIKCVDNAPALQLTAFSSRCQSRSLTVETHMCGFASFIHPCNFYCSPRTLLNTDRVLVLFVEVPYHLAKDYVVGFTCNSLGSSVNQVQVEVELMACRHIARRLPAGAQPELSTHLGIRPPSVD